MTRRHRATLSVAFIAAAGLVVIVSTLLPWATRESRALGTTTDYGAGSVGFLLATLAVATVVCAAAGVWYGSTLLRGLAIADGIGCVVCSILLSFATLSDANNAAMSHLGGSRTSRAAGAGFGIIGSSALLIACCLFTRVEGDSLPRTDDRSMTTAQRAPGRADARGSRGLAVLCFVAGSLFAALFLLIVVTKLTTLFADVRTDLVMAALGLAAFACFRAGRRQPRAPAPATNASELPHW